jgi:hypothetical protein
MTEEQHAQLLEAIDNAAGFDWSWQGFGMGFLLGCTIWAWYVIRRAGEDASS